MRISVAAFVVLPVLAACGGGGTSLAPTIAQPHLAAPLGSLAALPETQSYARLAPQPLYTPGTNDLLYVSNKGNNSITVYKHDANANTAPLKVIAGSKTGLSSPGQISEDAQGNLYVANSDTGCCNYTFTDPNAAVLVFAHGANGNVSPIRRLAGSQTGIQHVTALTVDQTTGKLFVSNANGIPDSDPWPSSTILRYPPNATGNEAPFATSAYYVHNADAQLASDSTGIYLLDQSILANWVDDGARSSVEVLAKQFPNNTTPSNPYGILIFCYIDGNPTNPPCVGFVAGVADDPATKTYLTNGPNGIQRFSEKANLYTDGAVLPSISTITSAVGCGQLALGYLRNIYAVCGTNTIKVFTHDSSGNVPPLRTLKGSATKLNLPYGIYEGQ